MDGRLRRPTRDHVSVTKCKGGTLTAENRLIVCHECNVNKSQRTLEAWHAKLADKNDPRAFHVARVLQAGIRAARKAKFMEAEA